MSDWEKNPSGLDGDVSFEMSDWKDKDLVIGMYDKFYAGKITRNELVTFLIKQLEKYIDQLERQKGNFDRHMTANAKRKLDAEDIFQECCILLIEQAERYDPRKGALTTFFRPQIEERIRAKSPYKEGETRSMSKTKKSVNDMLKRMGYEDGYKDDRLLNSPERIAEMTGQPLKTIKRIFESDQIQVSSIDEYANLSTRFEYGLDPQEKWEMREREKEIDAFLDILDDFQRYLIVRLYMYPDVTPTERDDRLKASERAERAKMRKAINIKRLTEEINSSPELRKRFGLKGEVYPQGIDKVINAALFKLRNSKGVNKLFVHKATGDFVDGTEQVDFELLVETLDDESEPKK